MDTTTWRYRLGSWVIQHRLPILLLIILGTVFFGYQATKVSLKNPTVDLFPKTHEFVETYVQYEDTFGGANVVIMALTVEDGDIFNTETLTKIRNITKAIELLPAVNNYQVLSIAQRKIKRSAVKDNAYSADPVMWPEIPQTDEIAHLRHVIYTTGRLHGSLVSNDDKGALIVSGFFERGLQHPGDDLRKVIRYMVEGDKERDEAIEIFEKVAAEQVWSLDDTVYTAIEKIIEAEEDDNHDIQIIGRPVLLGFVQENMGQIYKLFFLTIGTIIFLLALFYRDVKGVMIPIFTAFISAIWGIGFLGLVGFHFNPLVIVVPFIISARALSHSVQLIERFLGEYEKSGIRRDAAIATFAGLFKPGMLSIVTDAAGVFIVILTPIPLMEKLAIMGGFWVLSIIVSDILFNPILLSYLPKPRHAEVTHSGFLYTRLRALGAWNQGSHGWLVIGVTVVLFAVGIYYANLLKVGDVHPGTPLLWPDSQYNQDTGKIGARFGNTEIMSIVVEGTEKNSVKAPIVLETMEDLQRELEKLPEVTTTSSIADLVPVITRIFAGDFPKWEVIPSDSQQAGFYLEMIFSGAEPGDLARFITNDLKDANISVYLRDHKGDTLRAVVAKAREYIAEHKMIAEGGKYGGVPGMILADGEKKEIAKFRLAGNYGGLLAAVNETIVRTQLKVTFLAFALVFVFCSLTFRSALAGILFLIPIGLSNFLTYALMGSLGIGLDVNVLPVVALGVGLGVDYGVYIIGRIEEEFASHGDLNEAISTAVATAGQAVLKEAVTMIAGIIFWAFSFLRFQAEMGMLLAFWMMVSMIGGLVLLPTLISIIKPKFITRNGPAAA